MLFPCKATDVPEIKEQDPNKLYEVKLATVGKWKGHEKGFFELTLEDLQQMKANFDASPIDIPIDFEHATLWNDKAPATGWIKELYIKDNELWAKVQWLEEGLEYIRSDKYKYISPVFDPNTVDQVSGEDIGWSLHSAALTNRPFLEELGEVIANKKPNQQQEEEPMTDEERQELEDLRTENKTLKDEKVAAEEQRVEQQVDNAIAAKKVHPDQKEHLMAFGKSNPEGLTKLLDTTRAIVERPNDNLYENSKGNGKDDMDVLKYLDKGDE